VAALIGALAAVTGAVAQGWASANLSRCQSILPCPDTPSPSPTVPACPEAAIRLAPGNGPVRTQVVVHGCGFRPAETVTVIVGENTVADTQADQSGDFVVAFPIPSSYAGRGPLELTVIARGQESQSQDSATFSLSAQ
jgi:hypothetical protein